MSGGSGSLVRNLFLRGRQHFREARHQARYLRRMHLGDPGVLPDFLLIGAMKAGTTSLYDYVRQHPGKLPATTKEIQYFNSPRHQRQGERWHRAQFPTRARIDRTSEQLGYRALTGEATPQMHLPSYAPLAAELVPDARIVMILRDPVSRAYSHYRHWYRHSLRFPKESFWEALQREGERVTRELERLVRDRGLRPEQALRYSSQTRGRYADQMDDRCRRYLTEHFRPYNRRLFELIGEDWGWPS
ncbi:sulfotransferase [Thioalkalivibrio paradoxus ARh 1]|uniref:Sulfotransferase n=2 Tax=Thioalkalivibrio paradoxus TaxID=108010 RepID=W0DK29_9GAMM|nr:sulfotransferase [Thioalkalivibrio paradoxus ARh 1]